MLSPSHRVVLRLSGFVFVVVGLGVAFVTRNPSKSSLIIGILISLLGIAALFLWRWALALLSACTIGFALFCAWKILTQEDTRVTERALFAIFYLVGGTIPGIATYSAWRSLR